jgi:hypothetical protein
MIAANPNRMQPLAHILGGVFVLCTIWWMFGCNPQPQQFDAEIYPATDATPTPRATPSPSDSVQDRIQNASGNAVTFYKDILPLLTTNLPDRQYECTQCHASYGDPNGVAKARVVDDIIASVESGFMPMNEGPRMRKEEIEILKLWRRSGMQIGTPNNPSPTSSSSTTGIR